MLIFPNGGTEPNVYLHYIIGKKISMMWKNALVVNKTINLISGSRQMMERINGAHIFAVNKWQRFKRHNRKTISLKQKTDVKTYKLKSLIITFKSSKHLRGIY